MTGLRDQLQVVYETHGQLTPGIVVEEATPETSPLHGHFEWDNGVAGHKYRLVQARQLIRSCKLTYRETPLGDPQRVRAFVATYRPGDMESAGYMPTAEALADEFASAIVRREFERAIAALRRSYGHLEEYAVMLRGEADSA